MSKKKIKQLQDDWRESMIKAFERMDQLQLKNEKLTVEVERLKQVLKTIKNVGNSRGGESTSFYNMARIAARALSDE